jgi:hypothetical protein
MIWTPIDRVGQEQHSGKLPLEVHETNTAKGVLRSIDANTRALVVFACGIIDCQKPQSIPIPMPLPHSRHIRKRLAPEPILIQHIHP